MTPRPARLRPLALVATLTLAAGCNCPLFRRPPAKAPKAATATPAAAPVTTAAAKTAAKAPDPAADPTPATGPWDQLAALDGRRPVPLLPVMALHQKNEMQGHLAAIQGILAGLAAHDFDAIARSAKAIGSSPKMAMMCRHMGAGAPGFTERALAFHEQADRILAAARKHDAAAVTAATAKTLTHCTGCHATFRQEVVGAKAWQAATGMAPPAMATGGE